VKSDILRIGSLRPVLRSPEPLANFSLELHQAELMARVTDPRAIH
jgi:hypothetical protein